MSWSKEALVERQVREWQARRAARRNRDRLKIFHRAITITGEYGALSNRVGEVVAQQLGFRFYDREIIEMISEKAKVDSYLVEKVETDRQSYLQEIFETLLGNRTINDSGYLRRLTEVIGAIGHEGSSVIMGRAANIILGGDRALRIRCIAPSDLRIQRNSRRLCVPLAEAKQATKKEDQRRTRWVEDLLNVDPLDPAHYDLVISTGQFSVDQCAALVVRSYRAMQGDKRGLPVKMLRARTEQPPVHEAPVLWMTQRK